MAHRWWMTTTGCTPPSGNFLDFLAFLFLSPCPQRALLGSVNLVSLVVTVTARRRLRIRGGYSSRAAAPENEALIIPPKVSLTLTAAAHFRYAVAFGASAVFSAASVVLLALALLLRSSEPWRAVESAFLAVHAAAHGTAAWTVASSERGGGGVPAHLRVFWIATALGGALLAASAAVPGGEGSPLLLYPDDVVAFGYLLLSLPLAYVAATGFFEFEGEDNHDGTRHAPVPPYESASLLSLATFSWVNALISKGYAAGALTAEDVPPVPAGHRAEAAYDVFASHWPAAAQWSRHAVGVALCLSFWRQLLLTAVLGVASMAATYVGPSLVDTFVQLIDSGGTAWEALRLILILIAGKTVQTLASRHYSFQCALLEMRIRGALRTALYRKSLFLSTRARRAHGAGAIVNYMQADATNVSSAIQGIHGLWMTPLQIVVALLLPYEHFGPALFMAFAVIAAVTAITRFSNNLILNYQTKFLRFRDDRIKATTEMLNHMRLVKLQAWEEMFGKKVRELRQSELGWLRKIMILRCANDVVFSCAPSAMGVLVFGTYLAFRGQLDPGKVFTATAFFSTLAEPMRDYPQVILSSVKALVSLARLNDFLTDAEISRTAVQRVHSAAAGALAVKVEGGVFAWDQLPAGEAMVKDTTSSEPEMEAVLKGIDLELRKGELAAVVGTVGSGKSSLLSCIMGEMHKVSGQVRLNQTKLLLSPSILPRRRLSKQSPRRRTEQTIINHWLCE
ncbi:hypothetical protein PR202_gb06621 [Eleusine coracana subsp. coracana]|uniref:ABC transmembrane type-1 domain-containing protein n=1 Tax=Eleusine coracana subsp. coracana TaxID=191504 RepID=A0AAV5EA27_ELECO|nr:hypothetical protein PR202_gb06621 [Eleusine coracana subsp. coracana]